MLKPLTHEETWMAKRLLDARSRKYGKEYHEAITRYFIDACLTLQEASRASSEGQDGAFETEPVREAINLSWLLFEIEIKDFLAQRGVDFVRDRDALDMQGRVLFAAMDVWSAIEFAVTKNDSPLRVFYRLFQGVVHQCSVLWRSTTASERTLMMHAGLSVLPMDPEELRRKIMYGLLRSRLSSRQTRLVLEVMRSRSSEETIPREVFEETYRTLKAQDDDWKSPDNCRMAFYKAMKTLRIDHDRMHSLAQIVTAPGFVHLR